MIGSARGSAKHYGRYPFQADEAKGNALAKVGGHNETAPERLEMLGSKPAIRTVPKWDAVNQTREHYRMANKGISNRLLEYMQSKEGKLVTVEELVKALPDLERTQILSNMNNLMSSALGRHIRREKMGVYRFDSRSVSEVDGQRVLTFTVVKETDDKYILVDEHGDVYSATLIG